MTSEIPNNIISSRSEGDLVKLFWTCLFCPSIFLARVFYSAIQHFFARTENWGGVLFCFFFGLFLLHSFLFFFKYCMGGVGFDLFCLRVPYKYLINKLCRAINQSQYWGSGLLFGVKLRVL